MNKILLNPVVVILLATLGGAAGGLYPLWQAGKLLVAQAHTVQAEKTAAREEQKAQGWDFWTVEIDNLSAELKDERDRLRKESELLDRRAARIAADQQELDKVRAGIEAMRKEISDKVVEINADESKNLKALAQTYANLTPRAAVAIIKELDDVTAVKILSLMKPDIVGPIFEEMAKTAGPDGPLARRAALLSEKIRQMRATKAPTS